jgi:hypothetical protein
MRRSIRNTITSYVLFTYGCLLVIFLVVSFQNEATRSSVFLCFSLSLSVSFVAAMISGTYEYGMHFMKRNLLVFLMLTFAITIIWYLVCSGSFQLKSDLVF